MSLLANLLVGLVAVIQTTIGIVEMFVWSQLPVYKRLQPEITFSQAEAKLVAPIVANVGLYNWFLAAGLIWGLWRAGDPPAIPMFFLGCVAVAGIYGAFTVKWTTLVIQTVPAVAALIAIWLVRAS